MLLMRRTACINQSRTLYFSFFKLRIHIGVGETSLQSDVISRHFVLTTLLISLVHSTVSITPFFSQYGTRISGRSGEECSAPCHFVSPRPRRPR